MARGGHEDNARGGTRARRGGAERVVIKKGDVGEGKERKRRSER